MGAVLFFRMRSGFFIITRPGILFVPLGINL